MTNPAGHTPGTANVVYSEEGRRNNMAAVFIDDTPLVGPMRTADARRLAACWNACRDLSTETLELMRLR